MRDAGAAAWKTRLVIISPTEEADEDEPTAGELDGGVLTDRASGVHGGVIPVFTSVRVLVAVCTVARESGTWAVEKTVGSVRQWMRDCIWVRDRLSNNHNRAEEEVVNIVGEDSVYDADAVHVCKLSFSFSWGLETAFSTIRHDNKEIKIE